MLFRLGTLGRSVRFRESSEGGAVISNSDDDITYRILLRVAFADSDIPSIRRRYKRARKPPL